MRPLAEDTSPEAERVLIGFWRQATPARKVSLMLDTTRTLQEFMLAGLRDRHPHDSPVRLRRRLREDSSLDATWRLNAPHFPIVQAQALTPSAIDFFCAEKRTS